ncbi:ferredoxin [Haloechinothrix alba]|uniref:Ferredoxin n=1 Tax=Haloechinothrix alba TaxID=664784 RepID=A0A238WTV3_9PSEU|nr:ferredoxin [Haloechinothrix alba]SNR49771.1 ferredoxin [Haloechinothrix alba]
MKIHIDEDKCTGHGVCEAIREDVFEVGDDGVAHLITEELTENIREDLQDACDQCPTQALRLEG